MQQAVIDVTDQTFQAEVLDRSASVPVVVDLWAPWCGPCKTLGPILEKVVGEMGGQVILAKVNVDENPGVSQAFQVQSIPAVYAIKDGQPVDGFMGAQGEAAIREFVGRLGPSPTEQTIQTLLKHGDRASVERALEIDPGHAEAVGALARILLDAGEPEEALAVLARIPETEEVRVLAAEARLAQEGDLAHQASETRLAELLPLVKGDDDARQEFVDILEVMGPGHPRTADWRRKLSTALF